MEFLSNYGLFLAKTVTFVVAFGVIVAIIFAASSAKSSGEGKGFISVKKINDQFESLVNTLNDALFDDKQLKKMRKDKQKSEKLAAKKAKASSKAGDESEEKVRKRVFVTSFDGDIKASETEELREVITAILAVAQPADEVVVKLESPGGMVHGYGLAASQLARIREKGIPLTVCVDKVAASGGYMMACVANKIVAAPFAIIGSIGVVAQIPNFHRLLKKNDVDYEMLTAGEYKRTLTMFGENTDKGRQKFVEDLEDTHVLFKDFIREHREVVDVDAVATGEIWFGTKAVENNLIDVLQTSDAYLFDKKNDSDLYEVNYEQKRSLLEKCGVAAEASFERATGKLWQKAQTRYFS